MGRWRFGSLPLAFIDSIKRCRGYDSIVFGFKPCLSALKLQV